jgi:hypothetical protein
MNSRPHRDFATENGHPTHAVHEAPSERAAGLEAGNDHMCVAPPEVVLEMMANAPPGTHAAAGNDDGAFTLLSAMDSSLVRE